MTVRKETSKLDGNLCFHPPTHKNIMRLMSVENIYCKNYASVNPLAWFYERFIPFLINIYCKYSLTNCRCRIYLTDSRDTGEQAKQIISSSTSGHKITNFCLSISLPIKNIFSFLRLVCKSTAWTVV